MLDRGSHEHRRNPLERRNRTPVRVAETGEQVNIKEFPVNRGMSTHVDILFLFSTQWTFSAGAYYNY